MNVSMKLVIKQLVRMKFSMSAVLLLLLTTFNTAPVFAAPGIAIFNVTPSSGIVSKEAGTDLVFSVSSDDIHIFSVALDVTLSNATFVASDCSGSSFNSIASVISGSNPGSTKFTIVASYQGAGKGEVKTVLDICTVTIHPTAAGQVKAAVTNTKAYDADEADPLLIPSQAQSATLEAKTSGSKTTIENRTNKSLIPGDNNKPRVVSDEELKKAATEPVNISNGFIHDNTGTFIAALLVFLIGGLAGAWAHRMELHKKFLNRHGIKKDTK